MSLPISTQLVKTPILGGHEPTPQTQNVQGKDGGRSVSKLIQQFEGETTKTPKSKGPPTGKPPEVVTRDRSVRHATPPEGLQGSVSISKGPKTGPQNGPTTTPEVSPPKPTFEQRVEKFGSKTANLYRIADLGVKVPELAPVSSKEVFDHLMKMDTEGVIMKSWEAMKRNGKVDDVNLKAITDSIGKIFDKGYPFTTEQRKWIEETMAGKVIIARSTGDEDSADTPNAGGNESVLFVEPNTASVSKAMKEVVLSYFGADSLRNRIVGDGLDKVLTSLPKMPVLLMEMVAEPIIDPSKKDPGTRPPVGIAMSTNKVEFTGGEDFQFVSISSAIGPGVNEGSGRIEIDETFVMQGKDGTPLLIYQKPSVKQERIRAMKEEGGKITHQLVKNSKEQAYSPSLSREEARSLVTSTNKIKRLNGGATTEVEGVVGSDKQINFVQQRQIPDSRSKVAPTYVNVGQAKDHSKAFNFTTVVPKSGDALVIDDWSQVCFAETMKEAEGLFDWTGQKHKIVIVRQPDCSNSHPAVNFGSFKTGTGKDKVASPIPCLVVGNYAEMLAMKNEALSSTRPLVIDGQTQKAFVWTDGSFVSGTAISQGRISHHIGLETGTTGEGVEALVGKLKTTPSDQMGTLKEEMATVLKQYETQIHDLEAQLNDNEDTIHNSEGLLCQLQTMKDNFEAVRGAFAKVLAGKDQYTFEPGSHGRLLLVKFLESSLHDIESFPQLIEAEKSASKYLEAMKGSKLENPTFGDQVGAVKDGLTSPMMMRWKRFLTLAEQSGLSQKEITDFKKMVEDMDKMGVTAIWMSTVFDKMYDRLLPSKESLKGESALPHAKTLLQALVKDYETTAPFLRTQQAFQKKLEDAERGVADFSSKSKYEKAFANLKGLAETFIKEPWPDDLDKNPLKKAAQIESLGRMIEVYDSSIKALKNSDFDTAELLQKELEMLDTFKAMFESVFIKADLPSGSPMPKSTYVGKLDQAYKGIKSQVSDQTTKKETENLKAQSRCGPTFNVTNSLYNNRAKIMPGNVEEMFTTLHQSLEDIRGGLMASGGSVRDIDLPQEMVDVLSIIPDLARVTPMGTPPHWVGREITSTGVSYTHNLIVNDHGVKIRTQYEKPTPEHPKGRTTLEVDFYADNTGGRLQNLAKLARQISPGVEAVWGAQQFKAKFDLGTMPDLQTFSGHLQKIIDLSVSMNAGPLGRTVHHNELAPSSGDLDTRRRHVLNDFLNVVFGAPPKVKVKSGTDAPFVNTTKFDIKFGYPKTFSFVDGRTTHTLDLSQPDFGLKKAVFDKIPQDVLKQANQAILDGPTKFSFKRNGKTYPIDLTKSDLGLTGTAIAKLGLNKQHLAALGADLRKTLNVARSDVDRDSETSLKSTWRTQVFGRSTAYTTNSSPPGLLLWKAVTEVQGEPRTEEIQVVDNTLAATLQTKLKLDQAREKFLQEGSPPSLTTKQDYHRLLQEYHTGLQKTFVVAEGFSYCKTKENKALVMELVISSKAELGVIASELAGQNLKPVLLTLKERARLPFFDLNPNVRNEGKPVSKTIQERAKLDRPQEDRGKVGERISTLNQSILDATSSLTDKSAIDNYSMAMGVLASSTHLIPESDLSRIESTWKTDRPKAIQEILKLDFVSTISDVDAITKAGGTKVGLTNGGADCFINSSLQLVAGIGGLTVPKDMPRLGNFLTGNIQNGGDCRGLRAELRTKAFTGDRDIRDAIVDGTAVSQQDAASAVSMLLDKIKAPKIEFTKTFTRNDNGDTRNGFSPPTHILTLQLPRDPGQRTLSQVFTSNLTSQVEVGGWPNEVRNKQATQTLTLKGPAPDSTVISLSRFTYTPLDGAAKRRDVITGLTNPITLTDDQNRNVQYQANSIICHIGTGVESGHYVTYRKEGANWLLFNDNSEVGVRVDLNTPPHKDRIERDSYVVGMAKVGVPFTPPTIPVDMEAIPLPVPLVPVSSVSTGITTPITGSVTQVQSGPQTVTPSTVTPWTVTPWVASKDLGLQTKDLVTPNVLSSPTRPQTGIHEFHTKAFKAIADKGIAFPSPSTVKTGDRFTGKVTIEGKEHDFTATAKKAKGSGAVIWTVSLSQTGGSSAPTEFVIKTNPKKLASDSSVEFAALATQKDLREVQVLEHMSGNEHALQFHGAYSTSDGTLICGMEKAQQDMSVVLDTRVEARTTSSLVPSSVDKQLLEMSQALRDIHATGQVHGDVKPDNFMVGSDGNVRVGDFGECYVDSDTTRGNKLKDDLQNFATMAFNLRSGQRIATDKLPEAIENQQKDIRASFETKILEMDLALSKQISDLETLNARDPGLVLLKQQRLDLADPTKRLDTILQLSGGKLTDETVRSYLINDLLLKTVQDSAPTFDSMNKVSTQLAKLVAR
ncbi:protein kinase domain-containing protein [Brevifollis gellanilyticus]|uniref:USP domain-containing protein n=1 Tax=Brevifollis gellanilyticus TaxID=748831 RepID=A0A512M3P5_9BACT|nr:protein kinase [Brevifollis gellanilyticus]GEP41369.1 hypothetical protein BGE01nite_06600 [Brevifollis gellanilyticus]